MKKIIALLLALTCAFALFACSEDPQDPCTTCTDADGDGKCDVCGGEVETPEGDPNPDPELTPEEAKLAEFVSRITSSEPTFIKTITQYSDGTFDNTLVGKYETTVYGENFKMYCEYEKYAIPEAGADPDAYKITVKGTAFYKDGSVKYKEGGSYSLEEMDGIAWGTGAPAISTLGVTLNLTVDSIGEDYSFSPDGKTLTVNLLAEDVKNVLGVEIDGLEDGDSLELVIETDGRYLRKINVNYETDNADSVAIQTSYTYGAVESPFEDNPVPSAE
jgi:hypothetical protein